MKTLMLIFGRLFSAATTGCLKLMLIFGGRDGRRKWCPVLLCNTQNPIFGVIDESQNNNLFF
jgi:hypothetical protein